ncbi:MAG: response regulator transcription factor [Clostridia bacterium]|jgi:two-component system phosphate regulon response regulator PhoB|nr:response regulator transcription factor [Clostridia bacterium]
MEILLVEDNLSITKGLIYSLEQKEYKVTSADSIEQAINDLETKKFDLIILDISLPDGNGFDLYRSEISKRKIPTIFLTARDDENDIVRGLELGADDYMTKPFSSKELIARIKKILSRGRNQIIKVKDIEFDIDKMEVYRNKEKIDLSSIELKILHLLFSNLNKVVTREEIIEKIWDWTGNDVNDNTVTVYMKRTREKIKQNIIITIKGIGYRIDGK